MDKKNLQGITSLKNAELVSRLTKLEQEMQEIHLGIAGLNRYNKERRKQRIKEHVKDFVLFVLPYIAVVFLILILMNLGG